MIKFSALNETSSSDEDDGDGQVLATREAQEEEAYSLYNKALKLQSQGDISQSEELFKQVLQKDFISQAKPREEGEDGPLRPALTLKYLAYKNLAGIANDKKNYHLSMESYLEAMSIDSTDVSMWYRMGKVALNLPNYSLARLCFEEGLKCNPNHWPCLDNVITVMYALNDYANCLYYVAKALEKESCYLKGLMFKDQIYKEDPSLQTFCEGYFKNCDPSIHTTIYDKDEGYKFIQESLTMREKKRALYKPSSLPILGLKYPIKEFTWKALGESLVHMYDYIVTADPYISLGCRIDFSRYIDNGGKIQEVDCEKVVHSPATVSSSSEAFSTLSASPGSVPTSQSSQQQGGLLQLATPQQDEQDQQLLTGDNNVEMEVEDIPNGCAITLMPNVYTLTIPPTEVRAVDPVIYSDAPLGSRRAPKRKRLLSDLQDLGGKRRSARVRNTSMKKPQDNVNYQELLQKFLPSSLLGDGKFDDPDDDSDALSQDKNNGDHTYGQAVDYSKRDDDNQEILQNNSLCATEKEDIHEFIISNQANGGMLDLLYKYTVHLGSKNNLLWPKGLSDVYAAAFIRLRKHTTLPNLFCHETGNKYIKEQGMALLVFSELKVDQWYLTTGHSSSMSPSFSRKVPVTSPICQIGPEFLGKNFHADMDFLMQLTVRLDVLGSDWLEFTVRVLWLKAKFHSLEGEVDVAVNCMERLIELLQKDGELALKITVINCSFSNVITLEHVQQQLESLQRCQSLEEVQKLYEVGDYQSVVELLVLTFNQPRAKSKLPLDGGIPERHAQLILLQDSLWKLESYQECVKWSEVSFNEAIQQYLNASSVATRSDWTETMTRLLSGLDRCIKMDKNALNFLDEQKLVRLTQNLIGVICLQMENFDSELSLLAVLPWILLYRLIYNEEMKIKALAAKSQENTPNVQENQLADAAEGISLMSPKNSPSSTAAFNTDLCSGMPSSLMLLFTAHEYLGRRSWCCVSEGTLLLHCVDVMIAELQTSSFGSLHPYKEDLEAGIEQCFYCLYGHPNKRTKAKHLQEHNVQQIPLTWERAVQIFQYFKPNILPEFDSYRTSTVSAELENLLKRISSLVQPEEDPSNKVDGYIAYIEGGTDKCPSLPPDHPPPSVVVRDLYYLLGDYYFKNKEFSKAIKFYLLDICVNPDRQDSWAGMALSRSSQLEQKLNSYELKNETTIYRKSSAALRCFEHALELDSTTTSLWIEYGSLAYVLHSHASRQLKQPKHDTSIDDIQELLRIKREEMLETAYQCFKAANYREEEGPEPEEAWLHHYMLGKIAEKRGHEPKIYLDHYHKALIHLHEDDARYPKKIQYHNPPELSIEALEVYYRMHASSLKYLMKCEDKGILQETLQVFRSYLKDVAEGPFATFQENSRYESRCTSLSSSEAEELVIQSSLKTDNKSPTDHDYYHEEVVSNGGALAAGISLRINRQSVDSSSESQDSAAVKDVLYSIVSVVSERFIDDELQHDGPTIILGDKKIQKMKPLQESRSNKKDLLSSVTVETLDITTLPCESYLITDSVPDNTDAQHCEEINVGNIKNNSEEKDNGIDTVDELAELQKLAIELENQADSFKTAVSHSSENRDDINTVETKSSVCENVNGKIADIVGLDVLPHEKYNESFIEKKEEKDIKLSDMITDTKIKKEIIEDVAEVIDDMKIQVAKLIETEISNIKTDLITEGNEKRECSEQNENIIVKTENTSEEQNIDVTSERKLEVAVWQMEVTENVVNEIISENEIKTELDIKMEIVSEIEIGSKSEKQVSGQEKIEVMNTFQDDILVHCEDDSPPLLAPVSSETPENDISMDPPTDLVRAGEEDDFLPSTKKLTEISENCKTEIEEVIQICLGAMRECLQRFIQHYKSLYRMAYYYCYSSRNKNLQWSREILLAATPSWKNYMAMPGLFAERKNTNFFNGIWRFPSNEIDRPGSFGAHMYRSVLLLIEVLRQQADYNMLLYLTQQLYRTPDLGKKYMRDTDRMQLAREAYDACVNVLREQMNTLLQEEPPPEEWRLTCCLLEIYRSCQTLLKAGMYIDETNELLEEAYSMYKIGEVDPHPSVLEQAIKFCQLQLGKPYQVNQDANRCLISSKQSFLAGDLQCEGNSTLVATTSSCYTPDAWQREFAKSLMLPVVPFEERVKSDIQVVADSVLVIPVDSRSSQRNSVDSGTSKQSGIQSPVPTQVVHVEKPRAENLRACSVAFLPVTSVFPTDKTAASSSMQKNAALLSCQTFECYDILTTLMQASGYHVASQTAVQSSERNSAENSQSITNKDLDFQTISQLHNTDINLGNKRAWRKWPNKPVKQQPLLSFCAPTTKSYMAENLEHSKRPIVQRLVKSTCLKGATEEKVECANFQKELQDISSTKTYPKLMNYSPTIQDK